MIFLVYWFAGISKAVQLYTLAKFGPLRRHFFLIIKMERFFIDKSNRKDVITAGMRRRYRREDGTFDVIIKEKWDQAMKDGIFMHEGYVEHV